MSIFSGIVKTILGIIQQTVAAVTEIIAEAETPPIVPQPPPAPTAGSQPVSASKPPTAPSLPQPPLLPDISATPDYGASPGVFVDFGRIMDSMAFERAAEGEGVSEDLVQSVQIMRLHEPDLLTAVVSSAKSAKDALTSLFAAAGDEITEETARLLLGQQQRDCSCYAPGSEARLRCEQGDPNYPPYTPPQLTILPTITWGPISTPTLIPTSTPSHPPGQVILPTITPAPSVTPSPQYSFRLPVDNAVVTFYGCDWIESNNSPLRSRDVNPANAAGIPVATPANVYPPVDLTEVMIAVENTPNNGNFVALRVDLATHTDLATQIGVPGGYLYIGYSHLSSINVSPGQSINTNDSIGITGQTGGDQVEGVHLDIMAFAITEWTGIQPTPSGVSYEGAPDPGSDIDAFFRLSATGPTAEQWGRF